MVRTSITSIEVFFMIRYTDSTKAICMNLDFYVPSTLHQLEMISRVHFNIVDVIVLSIPNRVSFLGKMTKNSNILVAGFKLNASNWAFSHVSRNNSFLWGKSYFQSSVSIVNYTYQDTMVGNNGVKTKCVNENHPNPVTMPIIDPTITWFQVWYCKYVLLKHTSAVKHQHDTKTNNRPARSSGNNVLLFMWCSLVRKREREREREEITFQLQIQIHICCRA